MTTLETQHNALPLMAPAQARKHIIVNEALSAIDRRLHIRLMSVTIVHPPLVPSIGDRYGIPENATEDWSGQSGSIAEWSGHAWKFTRPDLGWIAHVSDADGVCVMTQNGWEALKRTVDTVPRLGIGAQANPHDRLSVRSPSVYFGPGTEAGDSGSVDLSMNRDDPSNNVRLLFKTADTASAEFGLVGDNTLRLKTFDNGLARTPLSIDTATGNVGIGADAANEFKLDVSAERDGADGVVISNMSTDPAASSNIRLNANGGFYFRFQLYGAGALYAITNTSMLMGTRTADSLFLRTDDENRVIIDGDGRVAIGDIQATTDLTVSGGIRPVPSTIAALPAAESEGAGTLRSVGSGASFQLLVSDGSDWRDVPLGAAI
jgi:hypothetical protein